MSMGKFPRAQVLLTYKYLLPGDRRHMTLFQTRGATYEVDVREYSVQVCPGV